MCWVQEANGIMIQGGIAEVHTLRGKNLAASEFSDCPSVFFFSFGSFPVPGIVREKGITELSLPAVFPGQRKDEGKFLHQIVANIPQLNPAVPMAW